MESSKMQFLCEIRWQGIEYMEEHEVIENKHHVVVLLGYLEDMWLSYRNTKEA